MRMVQQDFDIMAVLDRPLMAHLSTLDGNEPRESPVWFIWEEYCLWLFGTSKDSFIRRLREEPRCAVGVVDFDLKSGILRHVGIRGAADVLPIDSLRLNRFVSRYLGENRAEWNEWFVANVVDPLDAMVRVTPGSVVAKDVSYFKTGPELANPQ